MEISPLVNLKLLEYEAEPGVWKPVFTVSIFPAFTQEPENVAMEWELVNYSPSEIELQLVFEKPLYISFEKEPDILTVEFADKDLFITNEGIQIQDKHRVLMRSLMR